MLRYGEGVLILVFSAVMADGHSFGASAKSYKWNCLYTLKASPEGVAKDDFKLEFAYDDITKKAVLIGNQGVADVEVHVGRNGVTFLERLDGGVVQTTTVANDGSSVHSRHTVIGQLVPSQYYGQCRGQ